jgi:hypothetical protein
MFKKIASALCLLVVSMLSGILEANAQVVSVPVPSANAPDAIIVSFPAVIKQIDGMVSPTAGAAVPSPAIFFGQGASRKFLTSEATLFRNSDGSAQLTLSRFKTLDGAHDVNLATGSTDDGGGAVPGVAPGSNRTYLITWDGVQLETQGQPEPILTAATVGSAVRNPPVFFINSLLGTSEKTADRERKFALSADGVNLAALLAKFKSNPGRIKVTLNFDRNDPVAFATNNSIASRVVRLEGVRGVVQADGTRVNVPNDANPEQIFVTIANSLPRRAAAYSVKFDFPAADLNSPGLLKPGFAPPTGEEFVSAADRIEGDAPSTERAKTEFFFESTFTSIVNATNRKRSNVGLFGLHLKPVVGLHFFNVGTSASEQIVLGEPSSKRPKWIALRPLFDADVDTQPIKNSQAPNRIVFGTDFEFGIAASPKGKSDTIQQYVFLNGVRYDSDRDFKVQTLYYQTEFLPQFLNFEQTRDQRLRQFRVPGGIRDPKNARLFPFISSYYIRPSVGYQLGGTIKKGNSDSDTISRLFVKFGTGIELKRLIQFTLEDTYYFLQDASRRRNRNYLETRLDFNTGALFNVDLGALQSAITFKFQRGEVPPKFKPVNTFSAGFKLYR